MAALPICDELRRSVNSPDWEPMFILRYERENFVDELDILVGRSVLGKMAEFMKQVQVPDMPFSLLVDSLVAIRMNRLVDEMNEACQDRIAFVRELESVEGVTVTAKTAVFLKEMMDKEGSKEWQLHDLEKDAKEKALEIELFVQKLARDASS
ncbi:hypothetical protein Tco_0247461 [Tanacetum coccineum]